MRSYAQAGALNNAEWCDIVCRSHGITTRFDEALWVSLHRSPPLYPDAVTLNAGVSAEDVLRRVDASAGCSVKDSFASLDLAPAGFRVLLEAEWIQRSPDQLSRASLREAGPRPLPWGPPRRQARVRCQVGAGAGPESEALSPEHV